MPKGAMTKALNRTENDGKGRSYWFYECCVSGDRKLYYSKKLYDKSIQLHLAKCDRCAKAQWNFCINTLDINGIVNPTSVRISSNTTPSIPTIASFIVPRSNI